MPWYASDGLLYFTVLASAYYAYRTIPDTLNHIRNLAACPELIGLGPRKQLQRDAENAISIDTLRVLSDGYSYDLRASTIKIVAFRTVKSRTKKLLLKDLASKDEDRRYNAICGLWMLLYYPALRGKHVAEEFVDRKSFHALVTALKNVLADHQPDKLTDRLVPDNPLYPEPKIPPSPLRPPLRPFHELCLMMILRTLLEDVKRPHDKFSEDTNNITCALSAGLVTRWLKYYPFPCALPQNSKYKLQKSDVVDLFDRGAWPSSDDFLMATIIGNITKTAKGRQQLKDVGLRRSNYTDSEDIETAVGRWKRFPSRLDVMDSDNDVRMINGESTAGAATPPLTSTGRQWGDSNSERPRPRSQELSPEEENLRRRNRQAVVVADAGVPLSQENILQRTESGTSWRTSLGADMSGDLNEGAISSDTQATSPTLPQSVEERFTVLMQPIRTDQMLIERLVHDLHTNRDSDPVDLLDRLNTLLDQLHHTRRRVRRLVEDADFSIEERVTLLNRVDFTVFNIIHDEDTQMALRGLTNAARGTRRLI